MDYIKRVLKQIKLTSEQWDDLIEDFQNGEVKNFIKAKYNLSNHQYKQIKKYLFE